MYMKSGGIIYTLRFIGGTDDNDVYQKNKPCIFGTLPKILM